MTDKEKKITGISACHKLQGYSANNRPYSILMKSVELPDDMITQELVKAVKKHVAVELTFEEFLNKFFYIYGTDAELLTKLMGFETNLEIDVIDNPTDEWLQDYNQRHQDYLDSKLEGITLLKSAVIGEGEISLKDQISLVNIQKQFENALKDNDISFVTEEINTEKLIVNKTKDEISVSTDISKSKEKKNMLETEVVDITKSKEYLDLLQELTALKKSNEEFQKAEFLNKAKEVSFISEEEQSVLAEVLLKSSLTDKTTYDFVIGFIEKTKNILKEKDSEIEEIKKSFAGEELGADGQVKIETNNDAQVALNEKIAITKAKKEVK